MKVTPLAYLLPRLAVTFDVAVDPSAAAVARAEIAAMPRDVQGVVLCALCGAWQGWVA